MNSKTEINCNYILVKYFGVTKNETDKTKKIWFNGEGLEINSSIKIDGINKSGSLNIKLLIVIYYLILIFPLKILY
jgi:hypothetical protein